MTNKCVDCGLVRTLSYDTRQCHECEQAERDCEAEALAEAEGQAWHDAREGNGYPIGTIGAETR